jgi:hypothetical protein
MKYMVLIAGSEESWSALGDDEERARLYERIRTWWGEHSASGEILEGHELQPVDTATTVRRDPDGNVMVTDGPFIEGKEVVGGYAIIDVPDLDAAIRLVSGWPAPDSLEIRPVVVRQP